MCWLKWLVSFFFWPLTDKSRVGWDHMGCRREEWSMRRCRFFCRGWFLVLGVYGILFWRVCGTVCWVFWWAAEVVLMMVLCRWGFWEDIILSWSSGICMMVWEESGIVCMCDALGKMEFDTFFRVFSRGWKLHQKRLLGENCMNSVMINCLFCDRVFGTSNRMF